MSDPAPSSLPRLLTLAQVAEAMGVPLPTLYRSMQTLRLHGFPLPLTGCGRRYDPRAIEVWLARQRGDHSADAGNMVSSPPDCDDSWQSELDRRSAAMRS